MKMKKIAVSEFLIFLIFAIAVCLPVLAVFSPAKKEDIREKAIHSNQALLSHTEESMAVNPESREAAGQDTAGFTIIRTIPIQYAGGEDALILPKTKIVYEEKEKITAVYQILPFDKDIMEMDELQH